MINFPITTDEAKKYKYGRSGGNPNGKSYVKGKCACEVNSTITVIGRQCSRKNGYGPENLYCKQHAKILF